MRSPRLLASFYCLLVLATVYFAAPWPALQSVLHVFLVLGLAPATGNSLLAVIFACAGGWMIEGSLHMYPRFGGTPLADMGIALIAVWMRAHWPPDSRTAFWFRLAMLNLLLVVLTHLLVRLAAGPHTWGWNWLWQIVLIPVWGSVAYRLAKPPLRR